VAADAFKEYGFRGNLPVNLKAQEGECCLAGVMQVGEKWLPDDKHSGRFRDELVTAAAEMIHERWQPETFPCGFAVCHR